MITLIDDALLDEVCAEAAASPRRRKNRNFHPRDDHPGHRLLNALMADSYIPPHRHLDPNKDETYVVLRGMIGLVLFDDSGKVVRIAKVGAGGAAIGVDVGYGQWHTAVALADNSVFLEAKAGPYLPLSLDEKATWAPGENTPEAAAYLGRLRALFA